MGATTTANQTEAIARRFVSDVLNDGELGSIEELVAEDVVQHGPGADTKVFGPARLSEFVGRLHEAFPNLEVKRQNLVATEREVVDVLTFTGTHAGRYLGVPPTGKAVVFSGMAGFRIEDGRIAESWLCMDRLGALQELDALSTPAFADAPSEFPDEGFPLDLGE